ncbi:MAG: hypothetical protein H6667_07125 [Ardenticatenaceae bacterium]|nr:hypothetical protein [Ardenticatenaceae bacterium]
MIATGVLIGRWLFIGKLVGHLPWPDLAALETVHELDSCRYLDHSEAAP